MPNFVIYDCDSGSDDAWGLLTLIRGEKHSKSGPSGGGYKILAVTTVHGNSKVENVTKNTLRVLESADRTDIPLYKGCGKAILPIAWQNNEVFHGQDGFGDVEHENEVDMSLLKSEHAVNAMYDFVKKYPNQVDFLLVGPLTNFATCITLYGDDFLDNVGNIFVMGGNCRAKGNVTKSAEYNFMCDPEAAFIVMEKVKKPLTIVPWETCIDGDFGLTLEWRFSVLGSVKSRAVELLNKVERAVLIPKGFVNWIVADALLVAAYVFPDLAISRSRMYHATVELTGTHTRGQMVLDHGRTKESNVKIIMEIHKENYRDIMAWTAGVEGAQIDGE